MSLQVKSKMIIDNIETKMNSWIKTLPISLQEKTQRSYIVTGGAIASMLLNEQPKDYDVYFDDVSVCKDLSNHYMKLYANKHQDKNIRNIDVIGTSNSVKINFMQDTPFQSKNSMKMFRNISESKELVRSESSYEPLIITSNAITLANDIQIITRFVGDPSFIHSNFDFLHAMNYFSKKDGLKLTNVSLDCVRSKELKYVNSIFPIAAIIRVKKFIKRGWNINSGEIFKICWDIAHLDLDNPETLRTQLTGFYGQEFHQILSEMDTNGYDLTRESLANLVSKIFI